MTTTTKSKTKTKTNTQDNKFDTAATMAVGAAPGAQEEIMLIEEALFNWFKGEGQ